MWYYVTLMIGMVAGMFTMAFCVLAGKRTPEVEGDVRITHDGRMFYSCEADPDGRKLPTIDVDVPMPECKEPRGV